MAPNLTQRKGGPTLKLTPELIATVVGFISKGSYITVAAAAAGVHRETLYAWMRRGADQRKRKVRGIYRTFLDAMERAHAECETALLARIVKAGEEQWSAAAWTLERTRPSRYEQHRTSERVRRDLARAQTEVARRDQHPDADPTESMTDDELRAEALRLAGGESAAGEPDVGPAAPVRAEDNPGVRGT